MTDYPLITVISPCYNHSRYVVESLDSIRNQTYPNIEHIIIDDCSTDDSVEVIRKWIAEHNYKCTFIAHEKNQGLSRTLNESIRMAKGEYWSPLATDDNAHPEKIEKLYALLAANKGFDMAVSDAAIIDSDSKPSKRDGFDSFMGSTFFYIPEIKTDRFGDYNTLLQGNYIPSSVLIKTQALTEVGMYREDLFVEDWYLWLNLAKRNHFLYTSENLTFYRCHTANSLNLYGNSRFAFDNLNVFLLQEAYCLSDKERKNIYVSRLMDYAKIWDVEDHFRYKMMILRRSRLRFRFFGVLTMFIFSRGFKRITRSIKS